MAAEREPVVVVLQDRSASDLVDDLRQRVPGMLDHPPRALVVDLSRLPRLSSGAVAALLWLRGFCQPRGVAVLLRLPPRGSSTTLRRAGLDGTAPVEGLPIEGFAP
jgi:ABC-type transporter Mla MlaB component